MSGDRAGAHFLTAVLDSAAPFALVPEGAPHPLVRRATLAGDSRRRRRGLLGKASLGNDEGLVIAPTQGIHTFGMRFPVDVVFVDRSGRVLKVAANVPPNRVRVCWRAFAALELTAGRSTSGGVSPGVRLVASREPC